MEHLHQSPTQREMERGMEDEKRYNPSPKALDFPLEYLYKL